jgi:hypothetical protein
MGTKIQNKGLFVNTPCVLQATFSKNTAADNQPFANQTAQKGLILGLNIMIFYGFWSFFMIF